MAEDKFKENIHAMHPKEAHRIKDIEIYNITKSTLENSKILIPCVVEKFFIKNSSYIKEYAFNNQQEKEYLLTIVGRLPRYTYNELNEQLNKLYSITNAYGKTVDCLKYYASDPISYPKYILEPLFNKNQFKDFPSVY